MVFVRICQVFLYITKKPLNCCLRSNLQFKGFLSAIVILFCFFFNNIPLFNNTYLTLLNTPIPEIDHFFSDVELEIYVVMPCFNEPTGCCVF